MDAHLIASCRRRTAFGRSRSIMAPSSCPAPWKTGPISAACSSISFGQGTVENAFIESFNGRLRDECLIVHRFTSIEDAKAKIEAWRIDYNQRRPHSSRTPDTERVRRNMSGSPGRRRRVSLRRLSRFGTNVTQGFPIIGYKEHRHAAIWITHHRVFGVALGLVRLSLTFALHFVNLVLRSPMRLRGRIGGI